MALHRAVFFDRDDTLILNIPYLGDPSQVRLMPGARDTVQRLHQAGFLLFLTSNQSGVGRGLITPDQVNAVNQAMFQLLGPTPFTGIYCAYLAPGQPGADTERKPSPHLLLLAAQDHPIDLSRSFIIGDRGSDAEAGRRAGACSILLLNGRDPLSLSQETQHADFLAPDLPAAADFILSQP
ncbi:MAG: HAD-IIIA family hydrolase [Verrucomicrobiia bacterium]